MAGVPVLCPNRRQQVRGRICHDDPTETESHLTADERDAADAERRLKARPSLRWEDAMSGKDIEERIDRSVAKFESWYARLPLAVRLIGDVICLGVIIYLVALLLASLGVFGLTYPHTWTIGSWGTVLLVSVALSVVYELSFSGSKKA